MVGTTTLVTGPVWVSAQGPSDVRGPKTPPSENTNMWVPWRPLQLGWTVIEQSPHLSLVPSPRSARFPLSYLWPIARAAASRRWIWDSCSPLRRGLAASWESPFSAGLSACGLCSWQRNLVQWQLLLVFSRFFFLVHQLSSFLFASFFLFLFPWYSFFLVSLSIWNDLAFFSKISRVPSVSEFLNNCNLWCSFRAAVFTGMSFSQNPLWKTVLIILCFVGFLLLLLIFSFCWEAFVFFFSYRIFLCM